MADRGRPLPFQKRQEIKTLRETMGIKRVARALEVSRNTVRKYDQPTSLTPSRNSAM